MRSMIRSEFNHYINNSVLILGKAMEEINIANPIDRWGINELINTGNAVQDPEKDSGKFLIEEIERWLFRHSFRYQQTYTFDMDKEVYPQYISPSVKKNILDLLRVIQPALNAKESLTLRLRIKENKILLSIENKYLYPPNLSPLSTRLKKLKGHLEIGVTKIEILIPI